MGWESRHGTGQLYYTRTVRVGGRRKRSYFGKGPLAQIAEAQDTLLRVERELRRRERGGDPAGTPERPPVAEGDAGLSGAAAEADTRPVAPGRKRPDGRGRPVAPSPLAPPPGAGADTVGADEYDGPLARLAAEVAAEARDDPAADILDSAQASPGAAVLGDPGADTAAAGRDGSANAGAPASGGKLGPSPRLAKSKNRRPKRVRDGEGGMEYRSYASVTDAGVFELASADADHWPPEVREAMGCVAAQIRRAGPQSRDYRDVAVYGWGKFTFCDRPATAGFGIYLSIVP